MYRYYFALLALCLSLATQAKAENLLVVTEHMPPFQIINDDKNIEGYGIDVLKSTLKHAGIDYTLMGMNWDRAYKLTKKRPNTLLLSMVRNPIREKKFHWLINLGITQTSLWTFQDNNSSISSLTDVTDELIAVNRNDNHYLILKKHTNLTDKNFIFTDSKKQAIALVARNRAQYFLANKQLLSWRLKEMALPLNVVKEIKELKEQSHDLYIVSSINTSEEIRNKIKKSYATLKESGAINATQAKWF